MKTKIQKWNPSDSELTEIVREGRKVGQKMVEPLIDLCFTNRGMLTSIVTVAHVWARLCWFAERTDRPCKDVFQILCDTETQYFDKTLLSDLKKLQKKLERK